MPKQRPPSLDRVFLLSPVFSRLSAPCQRLFLPADRPFAPAGGRRAASLQQAAPRKGLRQLLIAALVVLSVLTLPSSSKNLPDDAEPTPSITDTAADENETAAETAVVSETEADTAEADAAASEVSEDDISENDTSDPDVSGADASRMTQKPTRSYLKRRAPQRRRTPPLHPQRPLMPSLAPKPPETPPR